MIFHKKLTALCLAGTITLGMAGCQTGLDTKYVASLGEEQIPAGVYLTMLQTEYSRIVSELEDAGDKPLEAATADGTKVSDAVSQAAKDALARYLATEQKFTELELSLNDDANSTTDYMLEMYWSYLGDALTKNGVAKDSYRLYLDNMAKQNAVFNAIYGEDGTEAVPEADMKTFFKDNYAKMLVVSLSPSQELDANIYEEETALYEKNLATMQDAVKDGTSMEQAYLQYLKNATEEPDTVTQEQVDGSYTFFTKKDSAYSEAVTEAMFAAKDGAISTFEEDGTTYFFQKYDPLAKEDDFTARKTTILNAMKDDEFAAKLLEWGQAALAENANQAALSRYTPDKLVIV